MWGRVALAGLLAGLAIFAWGSASHMLLGLTDHVMKPLPNEDTVLSALRQNVLESGLYLFPDAGYMAASKGPAEQQKAAAAAWERAYAEQPHGLLVVTQPTGQPFNMAGRLMIQLGIEIACALLAAVLLMLAAPSLPRFWARVLFVAALGVFASVQIDGPYWNWYGFPGSYFRASALDAVIGWAIAGLVLAAMIRTPGRSQAA